MPNANAVIACKTAANTDTPEKILVRCKAPKAMLEITKASTVPLKVSLPKKSLSVFRIIPLNSNSSHIPAEIVTARIR